MQRTPTFRRTAPRRWGGRAAPWALVLALASALAVASACTTGPTAVVPPTIRAALPSATPQGIDLAVLYTSDTVGHTDPVSAVECG